ncbi:MAG: phosphotransferase [Asgard group archaeon]|nr:phosphotransferase [Asgard group archaeon]
MNELVSKLQKYLSEKRGNNNITIENLEKLNLGFETEKYSFTELSTVDKKTIANKFVLRMFPENCDSYGVKNEFTVMDRLYKEGFPVPRVILYEEDKSILGGPFLMMEYIESKMFYTKVINTTPDQQENWMKRFAELLVKLHQIDWKKIIIDKAPKNLDNPFFSFDVYITEYIADWRKHGFTLYKSTLDWLKKQRENYPAKRLGLNHRDFHFANVIVAEDDSLFLVDWSYPNVSDIRMDIANAFCIFNMEKQGKLGNLFLEYYEEISGEPIGELSFYEVLSAIQLLFFCVISIEKLEEDSEEYKKRLNSFRFWIENLYEFLVERTQIRIPEIEVLLE